LLLRAGRVVPTDELVDAIWFGDPPDGAATTIRSYVSRLRGALGVTAQVDASASGYSLKVGLDSIDATRFDRLVRSADQALARGHARVASEQLAAALSLWRGRAFGDLSDDGPLRLEAERLEELRMHAVEARFEAEIAVGRGSGVVDEIEAAVTQHPYRERLWRHLMLALYHSGRQADALSAYQRARRMLDDQLGIDPSPGLQDLETQILRQEVPAPGESQRRDNLPTPQTSFVGRAIELDELGSQIQSNRLVTLTGVGGVGKTRLAIEVARRNDDLAPDGLVFLDLAAVATDDDVAAAAARILELRELPGAAALELVVKELQDAHSFVVLDNCEHVRAGAATLADALLSRCPQVRILATSRLPLGAEGETEFLVAPLAVPDEDSELAALRQSDAVRLLAERVAASRPRALDDDEALAEAARICRDLDGLPLAIELAAARAKAMSLTEIASRLDDRFRFLVSWRRVSAARHQTLKQAIDWSYDLLSQEDQRVFAALAVFVGGFSLDAAAAVANEDGTSDDMATLDAVARLVDASLVVAEPRDGEIGTRYRLLETVQQYAANRLRDGGAEPAVRSAHAQFFKQLAETAEPELSGADQTRWFKRLDEEHANSVSALAYLARDPAASVVRLQFTVALTRFWYVRGHLAEARRALEAALAASHDAPTPLRRRGLTAAASVCLLQGDYAEATHFAELSLAAARETGEERLIANGLSNLGAIVLAAGEIERAGALLDEAVSLARTIDDTRILALALNNLGDHALTCADYGRAEPLFAESLALLQQRGDTSNVARSLFNLGAVALMTGRLADAQDRLRSSLAHSGDAGDKEDLSWSLLGLAGLAAARKEPERAALLLVAATNLLSGMGAAFKPFERRLHDETVAEVSSQLGADGYQDAVERGRDMTIEEALAAAQA